jgi:hypothetical protein
MNRFPEQRVAGYFPGELSSPLIERHIETATVPTCEICERWSDANQLSRATLRVVPAITYVTTDCPLALVDWIPL